MAILFTELPDRTSPLWHAITTAYRVDETACVNHLVDLAQLPAANLHNITEIATKLVIGTREHRKKLGGIDTFLHKYDLSSEEGIALMCLAEALLRIPDKTTIDKLISDKISPANWQQHFKAGDSLFINAATWSLMMTGKMLGATLSTKKSLSNTLARFFSRTSSSVIRPIILHGMKIIGKQFVMGTTIQAAIKRAEKLEAQGYRYSYDMLGESAKTSDDAERYYNAYLNAIKELGLSSKDQSPITGPGISIKLSALHPRYEANQRPRVLNELAPRLLALAIAAKNANIGLTVDAEEADRLELSLDVIAKVFVAAELNGWEGFGLAVQAYQKRAPFVIDWLANLAKSQQRRIMIRLIKGAYWDSEIKQSQMQGFSGYPVFTRKSATDLSYVACAKKIFAYAEYFYPQFGTHNARTVATIMAIAPVNYAYEFQCLHGMGQPLYDQIVANHPCRIYAPVGNHKELLGYLVRRLLENGANTSFINRLADDKAPIDDIIADPVIRMHKLARKPHPLISLPKDIFVPLRKNSQGFDFSNAHALQQLHLEMQKLIDRPLLAYPLINGQSKKTAAKQALIAPNDSHKIIGHVHEAESADVDIALNHAYLARADWAAVSADERATCLEKAAQLFEDNQPLLLTLLAREGGKQLVDAQAEIREAVDFCYYYAMRAREDCSPKILPGPTGELNVMTLHPRGVIVCISPWNFPLAIFVGQIVAALVAGNPVIAKPAEQTPLIATFAIELLLAAGVPNNALQSLPGKGEIIGSQLVADKRVAGVMFTGSTETAKLIQQSLANRAGPIVPFIAETGGQNTMIVDSSALPEQVIADVVTSTFNSAGQRCSALRVLFLQEEIADNVIQMLQGAMAELTLGDPLLLTTDVGPVIDKDALHLLQNHFIYLQKNAKLIYQLQPNELPNGCFFAPCAFELPNLSLLKREVFGPILHIIRYAAKDMDAILEQITQTGYGLTLGIHSRIAATIKHIESKVAVGNIYINRNMIGAVVGVQPFGGEQLSGTGPKAGGPYYLPRLCVERVVSINTTAAGGNASLVSLIEGD